MNFENLKAAQERLKNAGGDLLGTVLWWSLNGNRVTHAELEEIADRQGLPAHYLPNELKPCQAFRRAWRHAASQVPAGRMLRPITETENEIVVGLVRERANEEDRDLEYDLVARITFDRHSTTVGTDVQNAVTEEVRDLYARHLDHSTQDVRSMLTTFLREAGIALRSSGGIYFVPTSYQPTLNALCRVVEELGGNRCYQLPVFDTPDGRRSLQEVAQRTLDDEVRQLQEQLNRFDDEKVRQSTLLRKIDDFDGLRSRVNLFAGVLSFKATALTERIATLQEELRTRLGLGVQDLGADGNMTDEPDPDSTEAVAEVSWLDTPSSEIGF